MMNDAKKTTYLLIALLYQVAMVSLLSSHCVVLVQLLLEHSSMFGLKVKVLFDKISTAMFPGRWHFHRGNEIMKSIFKGESISFVFHMS